MAIASISIIILLLILAGGILLQIFLSKRESRWPGLILPFLFFGYSLLMVFSLAVYDGMSSWDIFAMLVSTFLLSNIPTLIYLGIYFACREKYKRKKELGKMNIQDLE
ncbi:hypothetical protein [Sinanaerobacter chloroacetimidivorans]|jgi:hypothetical protein|uniref:Uncharacterized protein n=1 Tax=Sinanaerobacter chloroacetimidivorans TaxID=2818044 RepID=A0A8J7VYU6_9FIRM|nr:hypothetical protein [Sinanaerobacter chloroacetimidivorans]MBR0597627.1 hypothetical protein [Sinanaerobacter chloroacetimidivorans]